MFGVAGVGVNVDVWLFGASCLVVCSWDRVFLGW